MRRRVAASHRAHLLVGRHLRPQEPSAAPSLRAAAGRRDATATLGAETTITIVKKDTTAPEDEVRSSLGRFRPAGLRLRRPGHSPHPENAGDGNEVVWWTSSLDVPTDSSATSLVEPAAAASAEPTASDGTVTVKPFVYHDVPNVDLPPTRPIANLVPEAPQPCDGLFCDCPTPHSYDPAPSDSVGRTRFVWQRNGVPWAGPMATTDGTNDTLPSTRIETPPPSRRGTS